MKKLPLGIQHFNVLREDGCIYVDKTEHIYRLLREFNAVFLSRPRRFGKSLLLSTIAQMYSGRKDLFAGLWAENNWNWDETYPVVHFYMDKLGFATIGLHRALLEGLDEIGAQFGVTLASEDPGRRLSELIDKIHAKTGKRVVVLIDEYDKALVEVLHDDEEAEQHRLILSQFYGALKATGEKIKFLMLTGISKFSQVSVFSKLNHLEDITFNRNYLELLGYTEAELTSNFGAYLASAVKTTGLADDALLAQIKYWYNGYTWDLKLTKYVYNPVSFMKFCAQQEFLNHWYATGTPTFLIEQLKSRQFYDMENIVVSSLSFDSYTLEELDAPNLLFQTGYLTLRERLPEGYFRLDYPNYEVRSAFLQHLMAGYGHVSKNTAGPTVSKLRDAFFRNDLKEAISIINTLFENIPGTLMRKKVEADYHAMLYLVFRYMGLHADAEVSGLRGRSDAVLRTPTNIYVIEFKLDQTGREAVDYLREKGYAEKHRHDGRPVLLLGIGFSRKKREVADYVLEAL